MKNMIPESIGKKAVRIARALIENQLGVSENQITDIPSEFSVKSGIFVTLNTYPDKELRGCIGIPEPIMPLSEALKEASISAATKDPRFPPVRSSEIGSIIIEVTILTPPKKIKYGEPEELTTAIKIGRDGLIAKKGYMSGLLLPQVPVEYGWSVEQFLSHTCLKAGLHPEEWRRGDVDFLSFSGQVFGELEPKGEVKEVPLV